MNDRILVLLPWILPPLLGAVIGYITNAVAIAMLFRPLTKKKFIGLSVPFTPGIIPRQRYELAESIGQLIDRELLTEEAVKKQIETEEFRKGMEQGISSITDKILQTPINQYKSVLGQFNSDIFIDIIKGFLNSSGLSLFIKSIIHSIIEYLNDKSINSFLPNEIDKTRLLNSIYRLLNSEEAQKKMLSVFDSFVQETIDRNTPVSHFISDDDIKRLNSFIEFIYPMVFEHLIKWLKKKDVQNKLEKQGIILLRGAVKKLNTLQKVLISAAGYDKSIEDNMGEIISDAVKTLEEEGDEPQNKQKVIDFINNELLKFQKKRVQDITGESDFLKTKLHITAEKILIFTLKHEIWNVFTDRIKKADFWEELTLKDIQRDIIGIEQEQIESFIHNLITKKLFRIDKEINSPTDIGSRPFVKDIISKLGALPLQEAIGIQKNVKYKINNSAVAIFYSIMDTKIPDVLKSININKLVKDKIDSLDINMVESLILSIAKKHLRWITIFGAFLGAIMGMVQILINIFF